MWTICTLEAAATSCSKCLTRRTNAWRPQRISSPTRQFSGPPTLFFSIISKSTRSHSMPSSEHQHSSLNCVKSGTIWAFSTKSATNRKKPTMPFKKCSSCSLDTQAHSTELLWTRTERDSSSQAAKQSLRWWWGTLFMVFQTRFAFWASTGRNSPMIGV
jgi:hypothetical protein